MRGIIFRRIITELPSSTRRIPGPISKMASPHYGNISATMGGDWRRFYGGRRVPFVPPTYNELPMPSGSWEKHYKRENERFNKHLFLGIGFFLITITVVSQVVDFNFYPPPLPLAMTMDNEMCPPPAAVKKCT